MRLYLFFIMQNYLNIATYKDLSGKKDRAIYRLFEIFPGVLAILTFGIVILGSFIFPVYIAIFIITFDVYWLIKVGFLSFHLRAAFKEVKKNLKIDWLKELNRLPFDNYKVKTIKHWSDIYHLIILPFYKEDINVVRQTMEGLVRTNYPKDKFIVVLAAEERAGERAKSVSEEIYKEYRNKFFQLLITSHPDGIEGELAGKGSNGSWAGEKAKELIDSLDIKYENIMTSVLDVDTVMHSDYFAHLIYVFLTSENPSRASYQPIPFYTNNIWEATPLSRVVAFSATYWHMLQQERPERITTFSSHSMPFTAWVDVNFGQRNMVSEDSRIFWNCFLRYDGDYRVVPLYFPVSMDANVAPTFWKTMVNIYKQQRRWSWGVENIPYFLFGFLKNKKIPKLKKWYYSFSIIEGFWSWSTNALLIFLLGWLPVVVGNPEFQRTVLSFNLPTITRLVMTLAMFGLIFQAIITYTFLPPRPLNFGKSKYIWFALQWLLFPITATIFGALPGLDSQIRLMLGKYMGFWVTPKVRNLSKTPEG